MAAITMPWYLKALQEKVYSSLDLRYLCTAKHCLWIKTNPLHGRRVSSFMCAFNLQVYKFCSEQTS